MRPRFVLGIWLWLAASTAISQENQSLMGEMWVNRGLATAAASLQADMLGGEAKSDSALAVSDDGRLIAYSTMHSDIHANAISVSLCLADLNDLANSKKCEPVESRTSTTFDVGFNPQFSPDSQRLAYLSSGGTAAARLGASPSPAGSAIAIRGVKGADTTRIEYANIPAEILGPKFVATGFRSFAWGHDGNHLAVLVAGRFDIKVLTGIEISEDDFNSAVDSSVAPARLLVYDLGKAAWTAVSPTALDVATFDWAPDGKRLAFAGSVGKERGLFYMYNELYISNVTSGETHKIVSEPGVTNSPVWSPNGKWIAFHSQHGNVRWLAEARLGLYEVATGSVSYPGFDELGQVSGFEVRAVHWAPDSRSLLIEVPYRLSQQLFKLSIPKGSLARFTNEDEADFYAAHYASHDGTVTYLRQSFLDPPELYRSPIAEFRPRRLSRTNPGLELPSIELRQVSWPSRDGRWTIHGWLLLPKSQATPLPLLVYAEGGPDMVQPVFRIGGYQYPVQAFITNGVAVLIPNSRGRAGYGTNFESAWETERDPGRGPLEDDLAGVDMLVKAGIADTNRIALAGHSWGGYLAAYALTHTDRFKAIFVHEAVALNMVDEAFGSTGNADLRDFSRQLGKGLPFDHDEMERLKDLSPIYQVSHASTPSLLEFGALSGIRTGSNLFQGLKYFDKAPTELISYPRGRHVTEEPALRYDAARRDLEWFAYWALGKPTQRMLDKYGFPKISE